jgi:hypothetical protein
MRAVLQAHLRLLLLVPQGSSRWLVLHNSRLLLGAIKLMLFFLAFVISQSVYFAAFFGTESCFFSRTGEWPPHVVCIARCAVLHACMCRCHMAVMDCRL